MTPTNKRTQSELITTVLLILISITAVVLVGSYVINMVKSNLKSTDCFATAGQFSINSENSYFNSITNITYISIARNSEQFNLTGFLVSLGDADSMVSLTIKAGERNSRVSMKNGSAVIYIPELSETRSYAINSTGTNVNKVKLTPIIYPDKVCKEGVEEADIKVSK